MLTFMNSKLSKMTGKAKKNHNFLKSKSCEISDISSIQYIYIYIYVLYIYIGEDQEFIHIFH